MASLGLLTCFVVLKQHKTNSQPLTVQSNDLTILVGESTNNFYTISHENAIIEITADDPSIFSVTNNELYAIKAGRTKVVIIASLNGDKAKTSFILTVENESPYFEITPITNCAINNTELFMTDNACQFSIVVYDKIGQVFTPETINITTTNGAITTREPTCFVLVAETNCAVTFEYPELDLTITINVTK